MGGPAMWCAVVWRQWSASGLTTWSRVLPSTAPLYCYVTSPVSRWLYLSLSLIIVIIIIIVYWLRDQPVRYMSCLNKYCSPALRTAPPSKKTLQQLQLQQQGRGFRSHGNTQTPSPTTTWRRRHSRSVSQPANHVSASAGLISCSVCSEKKLGSC